MSSGFVSGGTADKPIERDDEWLKAQQEIEATRLRKAEQAQQNEGKTLFEVLQNNKAAKQEAFEESIKLKNQFRNLEEDEVDFLDSVLESTRAKEAAVKKETTEQLDLFRRQQEKADKVLREGEDGKEVEEAASPTTRESEWTVGPKKRKRVKGKEPLKGVKIRKSSSTATGIVSPLVIRRDSEESSVPPKTEADTASKQKPEAGATQASHPTSSSEASSRPAPKAVPGLGLAAYSSDEEES